MKRTISAFLTLTMLLACFAVMFTTSAAGTMNTGTRHQLCESLSADAVAYYKGTNNWESLSALSGKDTQSSVEACGTPLFNALHDLMWNTLTTTVSYKSLTSYWQTTDASGGSKDACLIYADAISSSYNREHVWPKSHGNFYESGAGSDLHHLRPSDQTINSTRGHWTFGNVKKLLSSYKTASYGGKTVLWYDTGYSGNNCLGLVEVNDNVKGDIARILLYVYVTYGKTSGENLNLFTKTASSGSGNNANTGDKIIYDRETLLDWCENDPVDTWEMSRNDCCAAVQGNRNVFIDYPEFAWLLFNQEVPDMDTPSGMAHEMQGGESFTITAVSSNEMMGTVSGSGRSYTAYPAEGYYVAGYSLVPSDAATVTQTGNTFTLTKLNADCTLIVNFATKTPAALSFSVPAGVSCKTINAYAGDSVTLPKPSGEPTGEYTYSFKGWVASVYDNVTDKPAAIYPAGSDYTLIGNTTLYALYTYSVGGTGSSTEFTRITTQDELTNGSYVFTSSATGKAMKTDVGNNWVYPGGTYTGETIDTPAPDDIWEYSDGKIFYTGGALACTSSKSISLSDEGTVWEITASNGVWTLESNGNIMCFNNNGWRPYGNGGYGSDKTFYVYKAGSGGTVYYTTLIGEPCEHNYVPEYIEQPTCTEPGYTVYICTLCDSSYQADETPALGHDYKTETVAPTATEQGYDLHVCSRCGDSYKDNFTDPTDPSPCEHEWDGGRPIEAPTCTEPGCVMFTCLKCDDVRYEEIEALGHDYVERTKAPSCTEDGNHAIVCKRCGVVDGEIEILPALGHDLEEEYFPATDKLPAYTLYSCTRCTYTEIEYDGCPCILYTDIDRAAWYHTAADFVIENGLMGSTSTESLTFEPMTKVSRSMVASILYRVVGNGEVLDYQGTFTDVKEGVWYTNAIEWCAANGLASGKGEGIFDPDGNVTRQELAMFFYKLAEFTGEDMEKLADLAIFPDNRDVPDWAKTALSWCVERGVISGKADLEGNVTLNPLDTAMRCELASILMRYFAK